MNLWRASLCSFQWLSTYSRLLCPGGQGTFFSPCREVAEKGSQLMASPTRCLFDSPLLENRPGSSNEPPSTTALQRVGQEPRYFPMETLLPGNHPASYFRCVLCFVLGNRRRFLFNCAMLRCKGSFMTQITEESLYGLLESFMRPEWQQLC